MDNKNLRWGGGGNIIMKCFSQIHVGQLLAPLEILMSKISLKDIPIHIHNFEHARVIMNTKLTSHGFLFHRNINRRENKAQIPLIIHHNEKKQIIFFWCATKDNWQKHLWSGYKKRARAVKIPTIKAIIKTFLINTKCYETARKRMCVYISGRQQAANGPKMARQ